MLTTIPIPTREIFCDQWTIADYTDPAVNARMKPYVKLYLKLIRDNYEGLSHDTFIGDSGFTCGEIGVYIIRLRHFNRRN